MTVADLVTLHGLLGRALVELDHRPAGRGKTTGTDLMRARDAVRDELARLGVDLSALDDEETR